MIDWYDWAGGREAMLRFGPDHGPVVVVAMPLPEEWNRTRAFVVTLLRALAVRDVASVLPDLPGHGESLTPAGQRPLLRLSEAMEAITDRLLAEGRPTIGAGVRSGALLDGCALHLARWHFAPTSGSQVLTDLHRTWLAAEPRLAACSLDAMLGGAAVAGTPLSSDFLTSLLAAEPYDQPGVPRRIVRLASDPRPADRHVEGAPLWRRSEPGNDPALAALLADDIADWVKRCGG